MKFATDSCINEKWNQTQDLRKNQKNRKVSWLMRISNQ